MSPAIGVGRLNTKVGAIDAGKIIAIARGSGSNPTDPTEPPDPGGGTVPTNPPIQYTSKLSWKPPVLVNPTIWTPSSASNNRTFAPDEDVDIRLTNVVNWKNGLRITGGRNIKIVGGECTFNTAYYSQTAADADTANRAIYVKGNGGNNERPRHVYFEGLKFGGTQMFEGMNFDFIGDPHTTLTIQNCWSGLLNWRVPPEGSSNSNHDGGDVLQPWGGPEYLRVDKFSMTQCTYQAIFLQPQMYSTGRGTPVQYDFRRIDIHGVRQTDSSPNSLAWLLSQVSGKPDALHRILDEVYVDPGNRTFTQAIKGTWYNLKQGVPPNGNWVDQNTPGLNYVSPGYEEV